MNRAGKGSFKKISSSVGLSPFVLGPSSGGDTNTILKTIRPRTATITNKAMNIPLQFLSLGELITNSCNNKKSFSIGPQTCSRTKRIQKYQMRENHFKSSFKNACQLSEKNLSLHAKSYITSNFILFFIYNKTSELLYINKQSSFSFSGKNIDDLFSVRNTPLFNLFKIDDSFYNERLFSIV